MVSPLAFRMKTWLDDRMTQIVPVYVINLDRRTDRMERVAAHLSALGITFHRISACDATRVAEAELDAVVKARKGLWEVLSRGDRACTVSHCTAWATFLASDASHALFLEDDIFLARDTARILASSDWIPNRNQAVKLEKFGTGPSRLLLGKPCGL
ncbi:MAG: glycosyltransferase family 25 protein, partial [Rhodobacteraceae bacterium]|nr:glycosyltransferase family 25 protein [Paracoccaceae bacterium]